MFLYLLLAALMVVADQLIKYWTVTVLQPIGSIPLWEGVFHLTYVENTGAAFSSFEGQQWLFALVFAVFTVMTLLQRMDNRMHRSTKRLDVCLELESSLSLADFLHQVRETGLEIFDVMRENGTGEVGTRCYTATLTTKKRRNHIELMDQIREISGVIWIEEL